MTISDEEIKDVADLIENYLHDHDATEADRGGVILALANRGPLCQAIRAHFKMTNQEAQDAIDDGIQG